MSFLTGFHSLISLC